MKKHKILIVDDEHGFTDMVKLNLEATGRFEVKIENISNQALNAAALFKPDLILLDVIMPEVEGPDVLNEIRNNELTQNIPIIFLTATVTKEEVDAEQGRIGGHSFLAKPSSISELLSCIDERLK